MRIVLDTNRYTDLYRGIPEVLVRVEHADEVFLTFVVVAELRGGFLAGTRRQENERGLFRFLSEYAVIVLYPDEQTLGHYATLWRQLRQQGTPIPVNDLWTAALVIQHGLTLFARDRHFDHLPQIQRV